MFSWVSAGRISREVCSDQPQDLGENSNRYVLYSLLLKAVWVFWKLLKVFGSWSDHFKFGAEAACLKS